MKITRRSKNIQSGSDLLQYTARYWAELIEEILPEKVISVTIEKDPVRDFDYRKITIEGLDWRK